MNDHLVEIQQSDLPLLKKLYTPDRLKSYIAYMAIENYARWLEQNSEESKNIKFYCLNGDFSDGTFVVTVSTCYTKNTTNLKSLITYNFGFSIEKELTYAYADTLNESFENLHRLIQLIDYSKGYFFSSIRAELRPVIMDALEKIKIGSIHHWQTSLYHLPKKDALKFIAQ